VTQDIRANGPWDESEVEWDGTERLDLGSLLVTATPGVDVQIQVDETSGAIAIVTLAVQDAGVQVQVFAAPKSGGLWDETRKQLASSINSAGGLVEEADGSFGRELRAQVPAETGLQPARFVGIEGPRWFIRAVFLGTGARPGPSADLLESALRGLVVVRGGEAMPVGNPLPLQLPQVDDVNGTEQETAQTLPLPQRGPEITEIR